MLRTWTKIDDRRWRVSGDDGDSIVYISAAPPYYVERWPGRPQMPTQETPATLGSNLFS